MCNVLSAMCIVQLVHCNANIVMYIVHFALRVNCLQKYHFTLKKHIVLNDHALCTKSALLQTSQKNQLERPVIDGPDGRVG